MEKRGDAPATGVVVPGHRDKYALVERERRFRGELLSWLAEFGVDADASS